MQRPPSSGRYAPRERAILGPPPLAPDPRAVPPNAGGAGPNVPAQSVGPISAPTGVILQADAWAGWPSEGWSTPPMEEFGGGGTVGGGGEWSGFGYGRQNPGGYVQRVSTVMTCSDLNGRQLASFPAYGVRGRVPVDLPSWYQLSPEPLVYSDWSAFIKAALNSFYLAGETVLWCTGRFHSGLPARFVALNPQNLYVDDDGEWYVGADDHGEHLERADVCHIPYQLLPGYRRGIGPLRWAGMHLVSAAALDRYAVEIARQGIWAVLKSPDELTAQQAAELQGQWVAARYRSAGSPAVLSGGLEFEPFQAITPKDMALLDLKLFDLQMIAAAFGVPPFLIGLPQPGSMTYSSTSMLTDFHWRSRLRPDAQSFSGAMSTWLLPRGTAIEFNPDRYVQPGLTERATAYQTLHGISEDTGDGQVVRAMTVDEIRQAERWAPADETGESTEAIAGTIGAMKG